MKKLEAYKAFTFVAWFTVVCFSLFTYSLVVDLQDTLNQLNTTLEEKREVPTQS